MTACSTSHTLASGSFDVAWFADTFALNHDSIVDAVETFTESESGGINSTSLAVLVNIGTSGVDADVVKFDVAGSGVAAACFVLRVVCSGKNSEIRTGHTVSGGDGTSGANRTAECALVVEQVVAGGTGAGVLL